MKLNSEIADAEERRSSISADIANRGDEVSLEVLGAPCGAQVQIQPEERTKGWAIPGPNENI